MSLPINTGSCTGTSDPEVQRAPGEERGGQHRCPPTPQCPPLPPPCPTFPRCCQSAGLRANKSHLAGWRHPSPASRGARSIPWQHNSPAVRGKGLAQLPIPPHQLPSDRWSTGIAQHHHPAVAHQPGHVQGVPVPHSRPRVVPGDALRVGCALRTEGWVSASPPCPSPTPRRVFGPWGTCLAPPTLATTPPGALVATSWELLAPARLSAQRGRWDPRGTER